MSGDNSQMRKGTLLLAVLITAAFTTTADAAKKKAASAPKMSEQDRSNMFIRDSLTPWTTTWAAPAKVKPAKRSKKKS